MKSWLDGKLVIRPDSGDPVDILCGITKPIFKSFKEANEHANIKMMSCFQFKIENDDKFYFTNGTTVHEYLPEPYDKGVIELLWDVS